MHVFTGNPIRLSKRAHDDAQAVAFDQVVFRDEVNEVVDVDSLFAVRGVALDPL